MPPRYQARPTDLLTRVRNEMDALGRPGMAGLSRVGSNRGRGFGQASVVADGTQENDEGTNGAAQLLVMSVDAAEIAPGGASVPFDSIVAQYGGFDDVVSPSGGVWVHPVSGVYSAVVKLAWATFTGGGAVRLLVNGVSIPHGLIVSGTSGSEAFGFVQYQAEEGSTGAIRVDHSAASAQTCDALVSIAITDPDTVESEQGTAAETFWFDSRNSNPTSTLVLESGQLYTIRITGNFTNNADETLDIGSPDAILYPSSGMPDGQAALDWDCRYADYADLGRIGHYSGTMLNLGSGAAHVEPRGGPYTTPATGHVYLYDVTGEGSALEVGPAESGLRSDNNGQFKIEIFEGTI